jgi:hypothetical protein
MATKSKSKSKSKPPVRWTGPVRCRLNAFDRDTSASLSQSIVVFSLADFKKQEAAFEKMVPFRKFYFDHEVDFVGGCLSLAGDIHEYINEN